MSFQLITKLLAKDGGDTCVVQNMKFYKTKNKSFQKFVFRMFINKSPSML